MREIKFRAWHPKEKLMEYDDFHIGWSGIFYGWDAKENDYHLKKPDVVLMQFTGLKDKNGKEIYEGDIVRGLPNGYTSEGKGEVVFKNAQFIVNCGIAGDHQLWSGFFGITEVIGNIYENPELLAA